LLRSLTAAQVLRMRMRSQRLTAARAEDVHDAVRDVFALQAQSTPAARLAVRPRSVGLDAAAVARACNEQRSVVRTWAMRGTLQMLAAEDVGWVVALLRPAADAFSRRQRELGIDVAVNRRALSTMAEVLGAGGPLTRAELVQRLAEEGLQVDPRSQAPAHLVAYAARQGLICRGPERPGDEPTYVLLERWIGVGAEADADTAAAELTRRFVQAHAPACVEDLAQWAGISLGRARRGFQLVTRELEEVDAAGQRAWIVAGDHPDLDAGAPCVRLLGPFDAYLLGYRSRDLALDRRFSRRVQAGGGMLHPVVVVDGRVVATWRQARRAGGLDVVVRPFETLDRHVLRDLEAEAADVGRFTGVNAALVVDPP